MVPEPRLGAGWAVAPARLLGHVEIAFEADGAAVSAAVIGSFIGPLLYSFGTSRPYSLACQNLCAARAFALAASSCRFFGAAVDSSEARSRPETLATSSTAEKNAAS